MLSAVLGVGPGQTRFERHGVHQSGIEPDYPAPGMRVPIFYFYPEGIKIEIQL